MAHLQRPASAPELLESAAEASGTAVAATLSALYDELRRIASRALRRERPGQTLQTTALVHEAYLRLFARKGLRWESRAHFLALAARTMRRILVDRARRRRTAKRGGGHLSLTLSDEVALAEAKPLDVEALDQALTRLAVVDPRQGRIVELRFFGGLSVEEAAEVVGVSPATVKRDWTMARAWLRRELITRHRGE